MTNCLTKIAIKMRLKGPASLQFNSVTSLKDGLQVIDKDNSVPGTVRNPVLWALVKWTKMLPKAILRTSLAQPLMQQI